MVRWIYPSLTEFVQHIPLKRSSVVLRSFSESRGYWPHLLAIAVLNFISMLLALASPLPMKIAVDSALEQQPLPRFLSTWLPGNGAGIPALGIAVGLLLAIAVLAGLQGLASWL